MKFHLIFFLAVFILIGCSQRNSNTDNPNSDSSKVIKNDSSATNGNASKPNTRTINKDSLISLGTNKIKREKIKIRLFWDKDEVGPCKMTKRGIKKCFDNIPSEITGLRECRDCESHWMLKIRKKQREKLIDLTTLNVMSYYSLEDRYSTPLQKKMYQKSNDFNEKFKKLKELKENTVYYIDWPLNSEYFNSGFDKYYLGKEAFRAVKKSYSSYYYNDKKDILLFDNIVLNLPQGIHKESRRRNIHLLKTQEERYDSMNDDRYWKKTYTSQLLYFKINDKKTALEIERNNDDIRLLIVFAITGYDEDILSKLKYVIIYNNATGRFYKIY